MAEGQQRVEFKRKLVVDENNVDKIKRLGVPFAFSGRIVEAYYNNAELDSVEIIWSDGKKNRSYHMAVDENDDQFQALLSEYSYESLDESTRMRNNAGRQVFRDAFHRYAEQNNMFGQGERSDNPEEFQGSLDLLFEFDPENDEQKEALFKLKLKIFEEEKVKNSKSKVNKSAIRKAKSPIEAISVFAKFK